MTYVGLAYVGFTYVGKSNIGESDLGSNIAGFLLLQQYMSNLCTVLPIEHLSWVVVEPVLNLLDFLLCQMVEIDSLGKSPTNQLVLLFIAATLGSTVWMAIEKLCPLTMMQTGRFQTCNVSKLPAIVYRNGAKVLLEQFTELSFQGVQCMNYADGTLIREQANELVARQAFCENQQTLLSTTSGNHSVHLPMPCFETFVDF